MKVLITGGAGFLGAQLARALLAHHMLAGRTVERLVIADLAPPPADLLADARVEARAGALSGQCAALAAERFDGVFHLAAAVSAECELDFERGLAANLDATRALLDALRKVGNVPRFVFASSLAVFGNDAAVPLPRVVRDDTRPTPESSYGTQKLIGELLVADYTRKGYLDGRSVRPVTVVVRPGRPNAAASGFLSGIIREPLAGREAICPVAPAAEVALSSPARTVAGFIAAFEANADAYGSRTALTLPALTVRVQDMLDALERIAGREARARVRFESDPLVARLVASWPARVEAQRAARLGLAPDPDFASIVRQYVRDHPGAVIDPHVRAAAQADG
ncbi:MAG TPA: D-erythronate dehydrogenase [Burkholderiaceae bacterium]|nr:D-erythronate dehydrogenase [Burkholderiaceae bacterium]